MEGSGEIVHIRIDVRVLISAFASCLHNVNVGIWLVFQSDSFILTMVKVD